MVKNLQRILHDKKSLITNPLTKNGIIVIHDPDNIQISRACIIGPQNTPYENGFYFFEFFFPDNYPYEPFKVNYFTNNGNTRMHPNFYVDGKVCVSIIGTWTGPGWTSLQSLESVLVTIQSLFIENPICQEPGFETEPKNGFKNKNYNDILRHENKRIAIIKMIKNTPDGFESFLPLLKEYLFLNRKKILDSCETKLLDGTYLDSPRIWNFKVLIEYGKLTKDIKSILKTYNRQYIDKIIDDLRNKVEKHYKLRDFITMLNKLDDNNIGSEIITQILTINDSISVRNNKVIILPNVD